MNTRLIAVTLGAASSGLLTAAFLSSGLAYADTVGDAAEGAAAAAVTPTFSFVPVGPEQITSINGIPPFDQQTSGYQLLDIDNTTTGTPVTVRTVSTLENSSVFDGGFTNAESLVTSVNPDPGITVLPTNAVDGAFVDTFQYQALPALFSNTDTEIPSATVGGTPTVTDSLTLLGSRSRPSTPASSRRAPSQRPIRNSGRPRIKRPGAVRQIAREQIVIVVGCSQRGGQRLAG
jgi:hypothetical protein